MPMLASEAWLCENKKFQWKMLPPAGIEPRPLITSDSKSNTLLSTLTCYVLLRSLNFSSCTTWFLDLDNLVGINRAWLYKELKVSVLQANVNLVQKGECWAWNQWSWEACILFPQGTTLFTGFFCFHVAKSSAANIGIIAIFVHFEKKTLI